MCKDNHEQPSRTCQCEENGFSTSLGGLVHTNTQNPSKPVEKPFSSPWHILLGCLWLSLHICIMARTKQTPRKPKGGGSVKVIPPKNKGKWGTAGQMIQHPIPNLPTHPTQNRSFYGGMYCRHCTIIMLYMSTQSIHLYCNTVT